MMFLVESVGFVSGDRMQLAVEGGRSRRPGRLASVVVEELADRIISGSLAEGVVLPTESALCEAFGFSRTSIREGLKLLQQRGLVRVEQGRGTTVQPRDSWSLLDPVVMRIALSHDDDMVLLDDLIAVRRLLESEMARAAATRLTEGDLAMLAESVEQMARSLGDYERFRHFDLEFHGTVMKASGSEVSRTIVKTIHMHARHAPRLTVPGARESLERTVLEHRAIYEALAASDGELAAARMAAHIDVAWAARRAEHAR
jgi:GntR family transcriptional regulator, galactonate operon transcriptional repressor